MKQIICSHLNWTMNKRFYRVYAILFKVLAFRF